MQFVHILRVKILSPYVNSLCLTRPQSTHTQPIAPKAQALSYLAPPFSLIVPPSPQPPPLRPWPFFLNYPLSFLQQFLPRHKRRRLFFQALTLSSKKPGLILPSLHWLLSHRDPPFQRLLPLPRPFRAAAPQAPPTLNPVLGRTVSPFHLHTSEGSFLTSWERPLRSAACGVVWGPTLKVGKRPPPLTPSRGASEMEGPCTV